MSSFNWKIRTFSILGACLVILALCSHAYGFTESVNLSDLEEIMMGDQPHETSRESYSSSSPSSASHGRTKTWISIMNCLRSSLGSAMTRDRDVRCVVRRMHDLIEEFNGLDCKRCEPYIGCIQNQRVIESCGRESSKVRSALRAVSECPAFLRGSDHDLFIEATRRGRDSLSKEECEEGYLCSVGCKLDLATRTCHKFNCREQ